MASVTTKRAIRVIKTAGGYKVVTIFDTGQEVALTRSVYPAAPALELPFEEAMEEARSIQGDTGVPIDIIE